MGWMMQWRTGEIQRGDEVEAVWVLRRHLSFWGYQRGTPGMARRLLRVAMTIVASEIIDKEQEDKEDSSLSESKQI